MGVNHMGPFAEPRMQMVALQRGHCGVFAFMYVGKQNQAKGTGTILFSTGFKIWLCFLASEGLPILPALAGCAWQCNR